MAKQGTGIPELVARDTARAAIKQIKKNPELLVVYQRMGKRIVAAGQLDMLVKWQIGKDIKDICDNPAKFGSETDVASVALLADAYGFSPSMLYSFRQLVNSWESEKQIKELSAEQDTNGKPFTVTHALILQQFPESKQAAALRRWRTECWSADAFRKYLNEVRGGSTGNNPGGAARRSPTPLLAVGELTKISQKVLTVTDRNTEPLDRLMEDSAYITPSLLAALDTAIEAASDAIEAETATKQRLIVAKELVSAELERREEEGQTVMAQAAAKKVAMPVAKAAGKKAAAPLPTKKSSKVPVPAHKVEKANKAAIPLPLPSKNKKAASVAAGESVDID